MPTQFCRDFSVLQWTISCRARDHQFLGQEPPVPELGTISSGVRDHQFRVQGPYQFTSFTQLIHLMLECAHQCWTPFVDISPINRDVIYRTRSAGSNISQYIGSTRETWILIIFCSKCCNLQHITLHSGALLFITLQRKTERSEQQKLITYERRHLLLPAAPIQLKFLCSALAKTIFAFVVIICGPL